jgi:uncharacterized protein YigE (DUF2233 family)
LWILVVAVLILPSWPSLAQRSRPCETIIYRHSEFVVCTIDTRQFELTLFSTDDAGVPYGGFRRLTEDPKAASLIFAMNAGMFDQDLRPIGLHIEEGREVKWANTASGPGNFHLKPNGVFYVNGQTVGVLETGRYLRLRMKPDHATQSGPMLVINGRIHPKISPNGTSRKLRNGVGVRNAYTAIFAISNAPVTFYEFAQLFRERLGTCDALFLDGSVSSLYAPDLNRSDWLRRIGPIIGAKPR